MPPRIQSKLPRRDLILLPLISLLTLIVILVGAEFVARYEFVSQEDDACLVPDARLGLRYKPDCTSRIKSFESPWITNHYNDCGYRSEYSCGPVAADVKRVAVLGSSIAMGYLVPEQDSFVTQSQEDLTRRCGVPVEFQSLGGVLVFWTRVLNRVGDALKMKPDAVLFQIATYDFERPDPGEGMTNGDEHDIPSSNLLIRLKGLIQQSVAWQVTQHYLIQNEDFYLPLYLRSGAKSDYLREPLSPFWQGQLDKFDVLVGKIADRVHAAGVPMALVYVPQRAQAELAARPSMFPDVHPLAINRLLAAIAKRHGIGFIDTTPAIEHAPDIADLFYAVDGHLDAAGHRLITPTLVDGMIAELPPFHDCRPIGLTAR